MKFSKRAIWPIFTSLLFLSLVGTTLYWWMSQTRSYADAMIVDEVERLGCIFDQIDATAGILSFEHDTNHINFLTVKSFVGSEVGPMNLKYPDKWQGPYLEDNPTLQEQPYQIAKAADGYYILPGHGVRLSSGNVIGKDIQISPQTNVQTLIDTGLLRANDHALARKISVGGLSPHCAPKKLKPFSHEIAVQVAGY